MQNLIDNIKKSGLSVPIISKRSGLDVEKINSIIQGNVEPNLNEVRKLSKALKVSSDFLLSKAERFPELNLLFIGAYTKDSDQFKVDKITYLIGSSFQLLDDDYLQSSALGRFPSVENTFLNARLLAGKFREFYSDGNFIEPLIDLPLIVSDDLKCILFVTDLGNHTDGASAIINNTPFIFISPRFEPRMLFTLAHEIAHIISHHSAKSDYLKIDNRIAELGRNKFKDEAFANAFASELLLPEEGVGYTLKSIREKLNISGRPLGDIEIIYLSRIYGVSFEVAAKRCEDLKLLPQGGAASLSDEIKKMFGSAERRAEELQIRDRFKIIFPRVSPLLLNAAIKKINAGELSIGRVSEILSIPIDEILRHKKDA